MPKPHRYEQTVRWTRLPFYPTTRAFIFAGVNTVLLAMRESLLLGVGRKLEMISRSLAFGAALQQGTSWISQSVLVRIPLCLRQ